MRARNIVILLVIVLLIASCAFVVFQGIPAGIYDFKPFASLKKGTDLAGCEVAVMQISKDEEVSDPAAVIEESISILEERFVHLGYKEATAAPYGEKGIRLEIPINSSYYGESPRSMVETVTERGKFIVYDVNSNSLMEGDYVETADAVTDRSGQYYVSITLTEEGAEKFAQVTQEHVNETLNIYLDSEPISSATVDRVIDDGVLTITSSEMTLPVAKELAARLSGGMFPVDFGVIRTSAQALLGDDAFENILLAAAIGIALAMVVMIVIYRYSGLVASISMVFYAALAVFLYGLFGVTLTLASVAGFILGAVLTMVANVTLMERMRSECALGKSVKASLRSSLKGAIIAVTDACILFLFMGLSMVCFGLGAASDVAAALIVCAIVAFFCVFVVTRGMISLSLTVFPNGKRMFVPGKKEKEGVQE